MAKIRIKRIAGYSAALAAATAVGVLTPVAVGLATSPEDAAAINRTTEAAREDAVRAHDRSIEREIAGLGAHPWAGSYYLGDGLGTNITISLAPRNGVAASWTGCVGTYGANFGHVLPQADGQLVLAYENHNQDHGAGFPERVLPVRWGGRRYLLTADQLDAFVSAIQHGKEPRPRMQGEFLLAQGDEALAVTGLPSLPDASLRRIRTVALTARVTRVEALAEETAIAGTGMCDKRYRLRLDVPDGGLLRAGDTLKLTANASASASARASAFADIVTETASAGQATALAKVLELDCAKPETVPARGWTLTTGAYDPVAANRAIAQAQREIAAWKRERDGD